MPSTAKSAGSRKLWRNLDKCKRYRRDRRSRSFARSTRDHQWAFAERCAREGKVWCCPWDKYGKHKSDGVYVFGLLGSGEFFAWIESHPDWWKRGRWSEKRCARSIAITDAGRRALTERDKYDLEPIHGGMVEPGWICIPLPARKVA
jgi:hypothetical protein